MIYSEFGGSIEDYDVFEEIGKGGFGKVDRARCQNTKKDIAIKKIDKNSLVDEKFIERVRQEVSIHSKLEHPSILKLYTFFEDNDYVYIVLELCPNGHLDQKIKGIGRPFYEKEAQDYLSQVVDGMLYLHSRGIMHRDLTLTNLLLDSKERVKIADFGLATQLKSPEEKHMTMCGTPNYISPEVASKRSHGLEADVWNFGCLVYTMLVGRPPFEAKFVRATLNNVLYGSYTVPDHLSNSAKDLISKCLKKNPFERIKLINVLRHPFFMSSHEGKSSSTCRSDSGVYTISTNATTHHTRTPLSAVCEDLELSSSGSSAYHSQKYSARNGLIKAPNSPPVKLKSNVYEKGFQHGGVFGHLKKKFVGLPFTNRRDPGTCEFASAPVEYLYNKRPTLSSNEKVLLPHSEEREISCMSGRSSKYHVKNNAKNRLYENEIYDMRSHSCNSFEEKSSSRRHLNNDLHCQEGRMGRPDLKRTDGSHRRSISSDQIISKENRCFRITRSSSLDRERYEEEMYKDKKARTHSSECQCTICIPKNHHKHSVCSCCHSNSDHRSWCNKCPKSPSKYSTKSTNSSSRNTDILKDIAPVKRSPSPPCEHPVSLSQKSPNIKQRWVADDKQILRIQCSPLSSRRLRATRQQTKNVILNILEDGEVCVEFLQTKRSVKQVHDICRISQDGMKIVLYKPNGSYGVPVSDNPPSIPVDGADAVFDYEDLPQKYWKKYIYAARFVKLVKAKTPKITYYSDEAKCFLMENSPNSDFEALFFSGEKLVISNNKLHITDSNGKTSNWNENNCESALSVSWIPLYQHAMKVKQHCLMLEDVLTRMEDSSGFPNFPIMIGKRPSAPSDPLQKRSEDKENISPLSVQSSKVHCAKQLGPYEGSMSSVAITENGFPRSRKPLTPCQGINILPNQKRSDCGLFIENIGTAYKDSKKIMVNYLDGTSLEIHESKPSVIFYTDSCKQQHAYSNDAVPDALIEKVWQLKEALAKFSPSGNAQGLVPRPNPKILRQELHHIKNPVMVSGSSNMPKYLR